MFYPLQKSYSYASLKLEAIKGAVNTLQKVDNIYLEHHSSMSKNGRDDSIRIYDILDELGFKIYAIPETVIKTDFKQLISSATLVDKTIFGTMSCDYLASLSK